MDQWTGWVVNIKSNEAKVLAQLPWKPRKEYLTQEKVFSCYGSAMPLHKIVFPLVSQYLVEQATRGLSQVNKSIFLNFLLISFTLF